MGDLRQLAQPYPLPPAGERVACRSAASTLTYAQLSARVDALAEALLQTPVGTRIGLRLENDPAYLVAVLACLNAGRTLVLIDVYWRSDELQHARREAPIDLLLTGPETPERASAYALLGAPEWLLCAEGQLSAQVGRSKVDAHAETCASKSPGPPSRLPAGAAEPAERSVPATTLRDAALVLWSSGTTGLPKPIPITLAALSARAACQRANLAHGASDVTLCILPLSHCHGIECLSLPTLAAGGELVLHDPLRADAARVLRLIAEHQVTFFSALPRFWAELAELDFDRSLLASLRWPICGSAALPAELSRRLHERFGLCIAQGYGLTEIGVIALDRERGGAPQHGSVGRVFEGIEWRLADLAADGSGELCVRSPGCTRLDDDGWLHTRDLVRVSDAGQLTIVGRLAHFLNLNGAKANPAEIEAAIADLAWVAECAVRAVVGSDGIERVGAWVAPLPPAGLAHPAEAVRAAVAERLALFKVPSHVQFLERLPRSSIGKLEYARLPEPAPRVALSQGPPPRGKTEEQVAAIWAGVLTLDAQGAAALGIETGFFDAGGTSLQLSQLCAQLESAFGRPVAILDLFRNPTIQSQAAWLVGGPSGPDLEGAAARGARQAQALRDLGRPREPRP
jgi:acyl-CoA synthetase (AMP-forming)/AMP-acid ligase II